MSYKDRCIESRRISVPFITYRNSHHSQATYPKWLNHFNEPRKPWGDVLRTLSAHGYSKLWRTSFGMNKPTTWCKSGRVSLVSSSCLYKTQPDRTFAQRTDRQTSGWIQYTPIPPSVERGYNHFWGRTRYISMPNFRLFVTCVLQKIPGNPKFELFRDEESKQTVTKI